MRMKESTADEHGWTQIKGRDERQVRERTRMDGMDGILKSASAFVAERLRRSGGVRSAPAIGAAISLQAPPRRNDEVAPLRREGKGARHHPSTAISLQAPPAIGTATSLQAAPAIEAAISLQASPRRNDEVAPLRREGKGARHHRSTAISLQAPPAIGTATSLQASHRRNDEVAPLRREGKGARHHPALFPCLSLITDH
jgi:hypothetical protein